MSPFEAIIPEPYRRKGTVIAERILEKIGDGVYLPGSKLPPERIIAESMGVSRPSVREAISSLQMVGILESRPGDGTYVSAKPHSKDTAGQAVSILETSDSPFEILQARQIIETGAAQLALSTATAADIQAIREIWLRKREKGLKRDYQGYVGSGEQFHMAIVRATGNRCIEAVMEKLLAATHQPLWMSMRTAWYREDDARIGAMMEVHRAIMEALEERDAEGLNRAMSRHFDDLCRQLYLNAEEEADEGPGCGSVARSFHPERTRGGNTGESKS